MVPTMAKHAKKGQFVSPMMALLLVRIFGAAEASVGRDGFIPQLDAIEAR